MNPRVVERRQLVRKEIATPRRAVRCTAHSGVRKPTAKHVKEKGLAIVVALGDGAPNTYLSRAIHAEDVVVWHPLASEGIHCKGGLESSFPCAAAADVAPI